MSIYRDFGKHFYHDVSHTSLGVFRSINGIYVFIFPGGYVKTFTLVITSFIVINMSHCTVDVDT